MAILFLLATIAAMAQNRGTQESVARSAGGVSPSSGPSEQFGFGASNQGFHFQFAATALLHVGVNFNLDLASYDSAETTVTATGYEIGPYVKFLLAEGLVQPYAYASFSILRQGAAGSSIGGSGRGGEGGNGVEYRVRLALGAEHFFSRSVGVYSHVGLINAFVSEPASFHIGLVGAAAGAEFFF
jgi:hypothetical protein